MSSRGSSMVGREMLNLSILFQESAPSLRTSYVMHQGCICHGGAQWHMKYGACMSYVMRQWHIHHRGSSMRYDVWRMYVIRHASTAHMPWRELNEVWRICHGRSSMMYGTCMSYVMHQRRRHRGGKSMTYVNLSYPLIFKPHSVLMIVCTNGAFILWDKDMFLLSWCKDWQNWLQSFIIILAHEALPQGQ